MPAYIKVGGNWRTISAVSSKVAGTWRTASDMPVKVAGAWKTGIFVPVVSTNLKMYLDVNDYVSGSNTWTDRIQNLTFTSQGTTRTPLGTLGGASALQFNNSGYWECLSGSSNVDMGGEMTLCMWVYTPAISQRKTIFEKRGTSYASYQQEIAVTWETNNTWSWYSRYPNYDYASTNVYTTGRWNLISIKQSTAKIQGTYRQGAWSFNGGAYSTSGYTQQSTNAVLAAGNLSVGNGYAGTVDVGGVAVCYVYDRQLTDAEILSNYNAQKARFGL